MRIGIVVGEASGDYLGAGLIAAIHARHPDASFIGICGPRMRALGAQSLFPMDNISIMGVDGLLTSIYKILRIRNQLANHFIDTQPDIFIGIDVPDFNLRLERRLRARAITTVHYVSPTVWAWRGYRIHRIRRSVTHMLTLFPFEADYYRKHGVPVTYVGHPVADDIQTDVDKPALRQSMGLLGSPVIALLPGSRISEVRRLTDSFIHAARLISERYPEAVFVAPFANLETRRFFEQRLMEQRDEANVIIRDGDSRKALAAADVALVASGTAALEAALLSVPMVVAYRVSWITGVLVKMFAHVEYFSMPNNLLEEPLVPELLQGDATPEKLADAVLTYLNSPELCRQIRDKLSTIQRMLRQNANERAARTIIELTEGRGA